MIDDVYLRLADADGLNEHILTPGRVEQQRGLQGGLREAAQRTTIGHRADEHAAVEEVLGQADPVAEQRAVGEGRGGVDGQHANRAPGLAPGLREGADERRLARAGRAGEADDRRPAGVRVDLLHQLPSLGAVVLDQRDRARERTTIAVEQPLCKCRSAHRGRNHRRAPAGQYDSQTMEPLLADRTATMPDGVVGDGVRRAPEPLHGGPLALVRFLRANHMLSFDYARLLARYVLLKLRYRKRLKTDGICFICPGVQLEIGRDATLRIGRWAWIGHGSKIRVHEGEVSVGAKTVMGQECTISAYQHVSIGRECIIADRVMLIDFDHGVVEVERPIRKQGIYKRDVRVGHNVWIGYGACVLRGVSIGDNSIVGTNAVVTREVPENAVVAGVPARTIRMRDAPESMRWE